MAMEVGDEVNDRKRAFFDFYRKRHPEQYSDSTVTYEVPLTVEMFDSQMDLLSVKKKQSEFENFAVGVLTRLVTPNIKPQSGPDGGGDGKVDAETYKVSDSISDKWYCGQEGASGDEKWAFAISCKKDWKAKVKSDVQKVLATGRKYTRIVFVSNQYIKSSLRVGVEDALTKQYCVEVEILDRSWLLHGVFQEGCLDTALSTLGFSEVYKKKTEDIGPHDTYRANRLREIEKSICRDIDALNTGYVDELHEACILARGLGRSRTEVEGKFRRAINECKSHGTVQQRFNIIYDHAWTSLFWFEDIRTAYNDYWKLKELLDEDCSIARLEKLTNIATILISATRMGVTTDVDASGIQAYLKSLEGKIEHDSARRSCLLFLRLHGTIQRLIEELHMKSDTSNTLSKLKSLIIESSMNLDIGFEALVQVIEEMSEHFNKCKGLDCLLDELADKVSEYRVQIEGARVRFLRAQSYFERKMWKDAVRQLSFCVYAFEKESSIGELIESSMMMGLALWELRLPYSAEAFLVKAVNFILKDVWSSGRIPHILITTLDTLCEIELMIGRLVMFFNWHELMLVMAQNAHFDQDKTFIDRCNIIDGAWACRFAASDLSMQEISSLPDVLERQGVLISSEYLKVALGYDDLVDPCILALWDGGKWSENLIKQPVFEQFLSDLNISTDGKTYLETSVNSFTFRIDYCNDVRVQQIAETFMASMESLMATYDVFDVIPVYSHIKIEIIIVDSETELRPLDELDKYVLNLNLSRFSEERFWNVISTFIVYVMTRNAVMRKDICRWFDEKQCGERMMDRVGVLQHTKMALNGVLGTNFKYRIEDWVKASDRVYTAKRGLGPVRKMEYWNRAQRISTTYRVSDDMRIWEKARWRGCAFLSTLNSPPYLGLLFEHPDYGAKIIEEWSDLMATGKPTVRVTILRGINKNHPSWYRVNIMPAGMIAGVEGRRYVNCAMGRQTMEVESSQNLDFFEQEYKRFGVCYLMSCGFKADGKTPCDFSMCIRFKDVEILNAWELRPGDMACMALQRDDDPVIPEAYQETAPVLKMIEQLKEGKLDMCRDARGTDPIGGVEMVE